MEKLEKPDFTKVIDEDAIENLTDEQMKELEKVLNKIKYQGVQKCIY